MNRATVFITAGLESGVSFDLYGGLLDSTKEAAGLARNHLESKHLSMCRPVVSFEMGGAHSVFKVAAQIDTDGAFGPEKLAALQREAGEVACLFRHQLATDSWRPLAPRVSVMLPLPKPAEPTPPTETCTRDGVAVSFTGVGASPPRQYDRTEIVKAPTGVYVIANPETESDKADRVVRLDRVALYFAGGGATYVNWYDYREWKPDVRFVRVSEVTSLTLTFPAASS